MLLLRKPLRPVADKDKARRPPAPMRTFAITELSDFHVEDTDALMPMRLDAVPADGPNNKPLIVTHCEPKARGNSAAV